MKTGRTGIARRAERLSEGQIVCLRMVQLQMTSKEIARQLGISSHTVDQRIRYAMRTLGASTRADAAVILAESENTTIAYIDHVSVDTQIDQPHMDEVDTQGQKTPSHLMHQASLLVQRMGNPTKGSDARPVGPSIDYKSLDTGFEKQTLSGSDVLVVDDRSIGRTSSAERKTDAEPIKLIPSFLGWKSKMLLVVIISIMAIATVSGLVNALIGLSAILN